ncbi:MAG: hypothetical protein ACI4MQ_08480 [Candidatus Coproplasma sp.]
MEELISIIKYSVLFISNFHSYAKLSKTKLGFKSLLDLFFAILLGILLYYTTRQCRLIIPTALLFLTIIYTFIRYKKHSQLNKITLSVISCGITITIMVLSSILALPLGALFYNFISNESTRNLVMMILLNLLQLILLFILFSIRRLKSGISTQNKDGMVELLLLISILAIFLMTLFYTKDIAHSPTEIIILAITFCGLALIIWWRKHITNNYQKQLYKRNEAIYEERIGDYEKERTELIKQNEELAKIIHRDNKLIPAMATAVKELLSETQYPNDIRLLLNQIEDLSIEHNEIIKAFEEKSNNLPKTNNLSLDAVIRFLFSKAKKNKIIIDLETNNEAIKLILNTITNITDLNTIICDLGENAIIATKDLKDGKILITFGLNDKSTPYISFYDNGIPFEEDVIANMGKKRITTHLSEGGSGIGLMTLFEILQKYKASYCLNETPNKKGFTKCIEITFDDLCNVRIYTKRENIKKICASRSDFFTNFT